LIIFRSPNARVIRRRVSKEQRVIWWSCDQQTIGDFAQLARESDYCVTISPYHTAYHIQRYGIDPNKIGHIDIGVRTWEYDNMEIEKDSKQLLFCSIPDRGLSVLHAAWPQIKEAVPGAHLVITSDYTLWGAKNPMNDKHRLNWLRQPDVDFRGKVSRSELVKLQCQSHIQSYPCTYEELFCISTAECSVAGAYPITSEMGALQTTNEFGITLPGNPTNPDWVKSFVNRIIVAMADEKMGEKQCLMMVNSRKRFGFDTVAARWEKLFETGELK
jgi:glycosyltransferase involved in cell wall biosynthesis